MEFNTRKLRSAAILPCLILFAGCGGDEAQFEYGPFTATYYFEDDGREPGQGTDGSDPDIPATFVAQEESPYPSVNYIWSELYSIESYNFHGVWEGQLKVIDGSQPINANFDVSWSDVSFYVNGELIDKWANSDKTIPLQLEKGDHEIRVEHHNHWHTTGFNVSFTNYPELTVDTAAPEIEPLLEADTKIVYLGAYEANTLYNEATVTLPEMDGSIMLFLASYNAVNWVIDNPSDTKIAAVVVRSYGPGSTVQDAGSASVFEVTDLSRSYDDFTQAIQDIQEITGRTPDHTDGSYNVSQVTLPNLD